jgi:hypothetical protein
MFNQTTKLMLKHFLTRNSLLVSSCAVLFLLFSSCHMEEATLSEGSKLSLNNTSIDIQHITTVTGTKVTAECIQETRSSGEIIQLCVPENWNGQLIIYAHGYVSEFEPLRLPDEANTFSPIISSLGFAFATTSFSQNGLAIQQGLQEIIQLKNTFAKKFGNPSITYITGASQGGIITALALERYPQLFNGGLSLCGPCGDFQRQVNYYGDFRVLFDYFFKGVLPGSVETIPDELIQHWETIYVPKILNAIRSNPLATRKLLAVGQAPYEDGNQSTIEETVIRVLWYNVFATRDAVLKLGGKPFENKDKVYFGSGNFFEDIRINTQVKRYVADATAKATIAQLYETTGNLNVPMVMEHTTKDPIQLFWHLSLYGLKTIKQGKAFNFTGIPVIRYGHCTFNEVEVLGGLALLILRVTGQELLTAKPLLEKGALENKVITQVEVNGKMTTKMSSKIF